MKRVAAVATCAALLLPTSCGEPSTPPDSEVAAELRALRTLLAQQQRASAAAQPTVAGVADRGQITTALQPLREVLTGLAESQRDLQTRQVTLTQEMQRWSQLLVETASGARQEEAKAMTQRLQQLEKALQEQDKRHREVEALMQGALERTADRLEDFLRRLEGTVRPGQQPDPNGTPATPPNKNGAGPAPGGNVVPPAGATPSSAPGGGATGGGSTGSGATGSGATGGGEEDKGGSGQVAAVHQPRRWSFLWWMLPLVLAAGLGWAFLRRLRRLSKRSFGAPKAARMGHERVDSPLHRDLDGVQEIWAAAALLSEAVDRLKQNSAAKAQPTSPSSTPPAQSPAQSPSRPPAQPPAAPTDGVDFAEVSVLGEDHGRRVAPPAPPTQEPTPTKPAPEPAATRSAPARPTLGPAAAPRNTAVRCRIPGAGAKAQAELLRLLADDPRVLRRPEPVMTTTPTAVEVAFDVLPGLPASERSQLEQRLRDAVS